MQSFSYRFRNNEGRLCTGQINSSDRKQALSQLKRNGIIPVQLQSSLKNEEASNAKSRIWDKIAFFKLNRNNKKLDNSTISNFDTNSNNAYFLKNRTTNKGEGIGLNLLKRLYELHKSGMPIGDAIRILQNRLSDRDQKGLAIGIWRDLSEGITLAKALEKRRNYFNPSVSHVIQAGEATGNLTPVLTKVIQYLEEKRMIRNKMVTSMTYPAFVSLVAILVVVLFLTVLLPQIEDMLERLGGEMTWSARLLIDGSSILLQIGPFLIISAIVTIVSLANWKKTQLGKKIIDNWSLKIPLIGKILYYSNLYQTGNLISTLLQSGINTTETLKLTEKTIENAALRHKFVTAKIQINEGASITQAFRRQNLMPDIALDILSVGEDTGELTKSMHDVTEGFKEELSKRLNRLTTIVSSCALGFAFGLVTLIAIGIVTSVFEVSKTLSI